MNFWRYQVSQQTVHEITKFHSCCQLKLEREGRNSEFYRAVSSEISGELSTKKNKLKTSFKVIPTTFWLKCINLPKYTKFYSTSKLEVADKNFGLWQKNCLMYWQIRGLKGSISGNICVVCWNL